MANCANHTQTQAAAFCRTCGKPLCEECKRDVRGVIYCEECIAARLQGTLPPAASAPAPASGLPPGAVPAATVAGAPNPVLAALLGFIPGVGAMYNGQFAKGFAHIFIFVVLVNLADRADVFGMFIAGWIFYMVFDAYKTAKAKQLGQEPPDLFGLASIAGDGGDFRSRMRGVNAQVDEFGRRRDKPPIGAFILIGLGVLFLLDNVGIIEFRRIDEYVVPSAMIVIGLWLGFRRWHEADEFANASKTEGGQQ